MMILNSGQYYDSITTRSATSLLHTIERLDMMDDVHVNGGINDMVVWGPEYVISDIARALI